MKHIVKKAVGGNYLLIIAIFVFFIGLGMVAFFANRKKPVDVPKISDTHIEEIKKTPEGSLVFTDTQVTSLFEMYKSGKDIKIASSLLQYLMSVGEYDTGYKLLEVVESDGQLDSLYKPLVAFALFNYAMQNGIRRETIDFEKWHIDGDTKTFHDTLTYLTKSDFSGFNAALGELEKTNVTYKNLISTFLLSRKNFSMLKDPPQHYEAGLVATTLMEAGYMPLAGLIASSILQVDKKYILSYEILSQIAIKQKKYDEAIKYLQILFTLDSQHISRTAFFLGKSYFWEGDYNKALVYLNQVTDDKYLYDAVRYMILLYHEQHNTDKMMEGFRYLLTEQKLNSTDYLLLYDIVFFEPYTKKTLNNTMEETYALKIIIPYIDSCRKNIAKSAPYVCKYGEAGRYLSQNKPEKALNDLLYLTQTYPHPTVYKALGDYYTRIGDTSKAQTYFMKSLITSADTYQNPLIYSGNNLIK